jgi:hypothetical protein
MRQNTYRSDPDPLCAEEKKNKEIEHGIFMPGVKIVCQMGSKLYGFWIGFWVLDWIGWVITSCMVKNVAVILQVSMYAQRQTKEGHGDGALTEIDDADADADAEDVDADADADAEDAGWQLLLMKIW